MNSIKMNIQAFSEVKCILDFLPIYYTKKIPKKILNIIDSLYDEEFKIIINPNIELKNQNFTEDTKNIIAVLKYNYWCKDDDEKENLAKMFKTNEIKYQEALREKYNSDNLFKDKKPEIMEREVANEKINLPMKLKKETFFEKVINYIKKLFIKNN